MVFTQPIGTEVNLYVANGVGKVVRLHDSIFMGRLSYPTKRSRSPKQLRPPNNSASCSVNGGMAESWIVTTLSGCRSCTMHSFLFFFKTVNQREQYDELDGSYVPMAILSLMILTLLL